MIFLYDIPKSWDFSLPSGLGDIVGTRDETLAGHLLGDRGGEWPKGESHGEFHIFRWDTLKNNPEIPWFSMDLLWFDMVLYGNPNLGDLMLGITVGGIPGEWQTQYECDHHGRTRPQHFWDDQFPLFSLLFAVFEVLSFCMADLRRWNPTWSNGPTWWPSDSRQPPALTSWRSPRQQQLPQQLPRQLQRLLGRRMLGTWGLQHLMDQKAIIGLVSDKCQSAKAPVQAAAEPPAPIAPTTMVDRTARHVWWPFGA